MWHSGSMLNKLFSAAGRRWIYSVAIATIGLAIIYDKLTAEQANGWIQLVAAVVALTAPVTALAHINPNETPVDPEEGVGGPPDAEIVVEGTDVGDDS